MAVHSVYFACLSLTFINLCVCFFPFWFCGWDVGFDFISSLSLSFYLLWKLRYFEHNHPEDDEKTLGTV